MSNRPTSVRWLVLGVTVLASFLLYLDRLCIGFAANAIEVDYDAVKWDGLFKGIFFYPYALFQVPAGMLSARYGIRRMLVIYILLWSVFTAVLGLATGLWMLLLFRLGFGLAQAGAYPCAARAVRDWMPFHFRGTASSIVAFGGRLGGTVAPPLTAFLMMWFALRADGPAFQPGELVEPQTLSTLLAGDTKATPAWLESVVANRGDSPSTDALAFVNETDVVGELLKFGDPSMLPLEVRNVLASTDGHARQNRQLWELAAPGAFKKLEARGWRPMLVVYGAVGLLVALAFWMSFREQPAQHPWCNQAEQELIASVPLAPTTSAVPHFPWRLLLTDRSMWGNCVSQFGTNVGWVFVAFTLPRYLSEVHHVPVYLRGNLSMLPSLTGMLVLLIGGAWTDRLTAKIGRRWGRRLPIVTTRIAAAASYILCILVVQGVFGPHAGTTAVVLAMVGVCLASGFTDLGVPATWAFSQDVGGRHTAAILGWGNMWGNLGAAIALNLGDVILPKNPSLGDWTNVFLISSGGFVLAALGGLLMDAERPMDADEG